MRDKNNNFKVTGNIIELLKPKWQDGSGQFEFSGCSTSSSDINITRNFSKLMPGIVVKGGLGYQLGLEGYDNIPDTGFSLGFKRYYKNGQLQ